MKNQLDVINSPQITAKNHKTWLIMLHVIIALCPALIVAIVYFGIFALVNALICVATCVASEYVFSGIRTKKWCPRKSSITDLSAIVTGLILALNIPTAALWWHCMVASVFAIVVVKMCFGGIGKNFANPAAAARIFLLLSFATTMGSTLSQNAFQDASISSTWLAGRPIDGVPLLDMLLGTTPTLAVGEVCALAILAGAAYLIILKIIDYKIPLTILLGTVVFAVLFELADGARIADMTYLVPAHILSGGLLFGAVFMATDYSTSPNSTMGKIIFALGIALFTMIIRVFGSWPEGVSFAILLMNIFVPLIDKYIYPKPFGYKKPQKQGGKQ